MVRLFEKAVRPFNARRNCVLCPFWRQTISSEEKVSGMALWVEQFMQAPLTKEVGRTLGTRSPDVEIHISHPDEQRRVNHLILNETGIAIPCIDIELDE